MTFLGAFSCLSEALVKADLSSRSLKRRLMLYARPSFCPMKITEDLRNMLRKKGSMKPQQSNNDCVTRLKNSSTPEQKLF